MTELEAKHRYVKNARLLNTWGITIFKGVKEKYTKERKYLKGFQPAIRDVNFGISYNTIYIYDTDTRKEIVNYKICTLKRYQANQQGQLTLDFGYNAKEICTFNTIEAGSIVNMISGYIDLTLLKSKQGKNEVQFETVPTVKIQEIPIPDFQGMTMKIMDLNSAFNFMSGDWIMNTSALGRGFEGLEVKQVYNQFCSLITSIGVNCGLIMNAFQTADINNVDQFAKMLAIDVIRMLNGAKFLEDNTDNMHLLNGAKALSGSITHLLQCSKALKENPNDPRALKALQLTQHSLTAANTFMTASQNQAFMVDDFSQQLVQQSGSYLNTMCQQFVEAAREVYTRETDPVFMNLMNSISCWGDELFFVVNTMAPACLAKPCLIQIMEMSKQLTQLCEQLMQAFKEAVDASKLSVLSMTSKIVNDSIPQLLFSIKISSAQCEVVGDIDEACKAIKLYTADFITTTASPQQISENCTLLQKHVNFMKDNARTIASACNNNGRIQLHKYTKGLVETTGQLFQIAKACITEPQNEQLKQQLSQCAVALQNNSVNFANVSSKPLSLLNLRGQVKGTSAATLGLAACIREVQMMDKALLARLIEMTDQSVQSINKLIYCVSKSTEDPNDVKAQQALLQSSKAITTQLVTLFVQSKAAATQDMSSQQKKKLLKFVEQVQKQNALLIKRCQDVEERVTETNEVKV
jgi:ribosomal protein S17E